MWLAKNAKIPPSGVAWPDRGVPCRVSEGSRRIDERETTTGVARWMRFTFAHRNLLLSDGYARRLGFGFLVECELARLMPYPDMCASVL